MPEVLTKHPDVVIKVLQAGGARCGQGDPPQILKKCPPASFCAMRGGEICVYGVDRVDQMTQVSKKDLAPKVCTAALDDPAAAGDAVATAGFAEVAGAALLVALGAVGLERRSRRARRGR